MTGSFLRNIPEALSVLSVSCKSQGIGETVVVIEIKTIIGLPRILSLEVSLLLLLIADPNLTPTSLLVLIPLS